MSEKIQSLAPQILNAIKEANTILLHLHPSPDTDSAGSALAMMHFLRGIGKQTTVIAGDSKFPKPLEILPGADQILQKNYSEINAGQFDLFLILDSSAPNQISQLTEIVFPSSMTTIVIDHHDSNKEYGQINLVDTSYIAVAQIIYELFELWDVEITQDIAACLFLGIYSDSGGFKYNRTDSKTFEIASKLSKIIPNFPDLIFDLENSNTPERIKYIGLCLNNIQTYFSGRVAISSAKLEDLQRLGIKKSDTEKAAISNYLKSVIGWYIGITIHAKEEDVFGLDFRTRDAQKYDVSKIASALGGGGHKAAAGAELKGPLDQVLEKLLSTIAQLYPDLGQPK